MKKVDPRGFTDWEHEPDEHDQWAAEETRPERPSMTERSQEQPIDKDAVTLCGVGQPKRIWLVDLGGGDIEWASDLPDVTEDCAGAVEYVRADLAQPTEQTDDAMVERVRGAIIDAAITGGGSYRRDIEMIAGPPERLARAAIAAMPTGQTNRLDQPAVHPYAAVCYRRDGDGWKQVSITQSEHDLEAAMDIGIAKLETGNDRTG